MKSLIPFLLLALAGCGAAPQAYVPTPTTKVEPISTDVASAAALMPLAVGSKWTYAMRTERFRNGAPVGTEDSTAVYRVAAAKGNDFTLLLETDGRKLDATDWRVTADGIYQLSTGVDRTPTVPPQPLALLPMKAGHRFSWSGKAAMPEGTITHGTAEGEVLAEQPVDTGIGQLSAIPVRVRLKFPTGESESTSWYRPDMGLVRYRQTTTSKGQGIVLTLSLTNPPNKP